MPQQDYNRQNVQKWEQITNLMRLGMVGLISLFALVCGISAIVTLVKGIPIHVNSWILLGVGLMFCALTAFFGLFFVKSVPFVIFHFLGTHLMMGISPSFFVYGFLNGGMPMAVQIILYAVYAISIIADIVYSVLSLFIWKYK